MHGNKCQRMATSGTTSDNELQRVVQRVATRDSERQRVKTNGNEPSFWLIFLFSNKKGC